MNNQRAKGQTARRAARRHFIAAVDHVCRVIGTVKAERILRYAAERIDNSKPRWCPERLFGIGPPVRAPEVRDHAGGCPGGLCSCPEAT
jgi:hypothetical protein